MKIIGKKKLYPYGEEGICTYEYVMINGLKQYIQIRGRKKTNPVILFIHGGPGGAISGLCHLPDYMKDIDEVIAYLHTRYEFEKLYIMGFSWGSVIGAEYARLHPENVIAYIGVGQLISYEKGFKLICENTLDIAKSQNHQKDVASLTALLDNYPAENSMTTERMKSVRQFAMLANKYLVKHAKPFPIMQILSSPFLSWKEKKAMFLSDINLYEETYKTMLSYNFMSEADFDVPIYFISGEEDINCPASLVQSSMNGIKAPHKKLYMIEEASHMCFYDQAEKFNEMLIQIKQSESF